MRKHHCPRHVRHAAKQLAIDEIGDAAKKQADRHSTSDRIADRPIVELALTAKQYDRNDDTDQTAMKRHTTLPNLQDGERI